MHKNSTRTIRTLILWLLALVTTACAVTPQKIVEEKGWIPLDTFDLVKLTNISTPNTECSSSVRPALIGQVLPYAPLKRYGWFQSNHTLLPGSLLLADNLDLSTCYTHGPQKVFEQLGYKVKLTSIDLGTLVNAGIEVSNSSEVEIKNVWHARALMSKEQQVKLLQKLDTRETSAVFIVTNALIGDISNSEQVFVKGGGKIKASDFEVNVDVIQFGNEKKQEKLSGISLSLGVRGNVFRKISSDSIPKFELPNPGEDKDIAVGENEKLKIIRTRGNKLDFDRYGQQISIFSRSRSGKWLEDTQSLLAALQLPPVGARNIPENKNTTGGTGRAIASVDIGEDNNFSTGTSPERKDDVELTNIRIVSTNLTGEVSDVVSLQVSRNQRTGKDYAYGQAYRVISKPINSTEDWEKYLKTPL